MAISVVSALEYVVALFARTVFIPLIALAAVVHGAQPSEPLIGKWKIKSVLAPITGPEAQKAKAMVRNSTIEFRKDKTFAMLLVEPMKGRWKVTGHDVALKITFAMGRNMSEIVDMARAAYENDPSPRNKAALDELSKPMRAVLSADGKVLTFKPAAGRLQLIFQKT